MTNCSSSCVRNYLSTQPSPEHATTGSTEKETIVIPKRIHRGPTDILRALASTVNTDYTAPHFKYHDDPFFIPASNIAKRTYALAKESGKKAAKYFLEKYPDSFINNPAEPNVEVGTNVAFIFMKLIETSTALMVFELLTGI